MSQCCLWWQFFFRCVGIYLYSELIGPLLADEISIIFLIEGIGLKLIHLVQVTGSVSFETLRWIKANEYLKTFLLDSHGRIFTFFSYWKVSYLLRIEITCIIVTYKSSRGGLTSILVAVCLKDQTTESCSCSIWNNALGIRFGSAVALVHSVNIISLWWHFGHNQFLVKGHDAGLYTLKYMTMKLKSAGHGCILLACRPKGCNQKEWFMVRIKVAQIVVVPTWFPVTWSH